MHNPFAELVDESTDYELIEQSKNGSQASLEKLILRHQAWVYNIALRMVFHPHDAEEVTQEVLIKVITRLSTFNGESKFRTWLYRIAINHVLNMRRRGGESDQQTFSTYADAINATPISTCRIRSRCLSKYRCWWKKQRFLVPLGCSCASIVNSG